MAPLPENSTMRVWLDYTSVGVPHSLMFRPSSNPDPTEAEQMGTALANHLSNIMLSSDSVYAMRMALPGSDFSVPLQLIPVQGVITPGNSTWLEDPDSAQISITGRSTASGRDVKWSFFTPYNFGAAWPTNNRYQAGSPGALAAFRTLFDGFVAGNNAVSIPVVAIDNATVGLNGYTNIRKNGYRQTKQRRG